MHYFIVSCMPDTTIMCCNIIKWSTLQINDHSRLSDHLNKDGDTRSFTFSIKSSHDSNCVVFYCNGKPNDTGNKINNMYEILRSHVHVGEAKWLTTYTSCQGAIQLKVLDHFGTLLQFGRPFQLENCGILLDENHHPLASRMLGLLFLQPPSLSNCQNSIGWPS